MVTTAMAVSSSISSGSVRSRVAPRLASGRTAAPLLRRRQAGGEADRADVVRGLATGGGPRRRTREVSPTERTA